MVGGHRYGVHNNGNYSCYVLGTMSCSELWPRDGVKSPVVGLLNAAWQPFV